MPLISSLRQKLPNLIEVTTNTVLESLSSANVLFLNHFLPRMYVCM